MFEVLTRDGAARLGKLAQAGLDLATPGVLYVDTPRIAAPSWAPALLAQTKPAREVPWVQDRASRFSAIPRDSSAAAAIEADLPYTPAGGAALLQAAHEANVATRAASEWAVLPVPADASGDVVVFGAARALFENPYTFSKHATVLRERTMASALYAPGLGLPHEIALLAYLGVDLFDTTTLALESRRGRYLTPEGPVDPAALDPKDLPCTCPACARGDVTRDGLYEHALFAQRAEVARVRTAIREGRLRELVESRIRARPNLAAHLRRFDREAYGFFEPRAPVTREGTLYATSKESLTRPEVERWRRRLSERYAKPEGARILVLLPCSARKPYSQSRTHRQLAKYLAGIPNYGVVHEVILTSPLGLVPREVENVYPAAHYDLPVTGHWDDDERGMIRDAATSLLARSRYDSIVVHLEEVEMEIVSPVLGEFTYTCEGDPLSSGSLGTLRRTLSDLAVKAPRVSWRERELADFASLARWQFGEAGDALLAGCTVKGKPPYQRFFDEEGKQVAMLTERGLFTVAPAGGRRLLDAGAYRVGIEDFRPKGTVFAVGIVSADDAIRTGDDVVLHHADEFRGVGRALMPGCEMPVVKRGAAVNVRHKEAAP